MLWILEPEIGHHIHKKVNLTMWFHISIRPIYKKTLIALPNLYFPKAALVERLTWMLMMKKNESSTLLSFFLCLYHKMKFRKLYKPTVLQVTSRHRKRFIYIQTTISTQLSTTHHTWLATNSWTGLEGREARWSSRLSDFNQSAATNCITGSWATTLKMHIKMR